MGVAAGRRGRTSPGPGAVRFPGRAAGLRAADGRRRRRAALAQADRRRAGRAARRSAAPRRPRRPTRNRFLGFGKTVRWPEGRHSENGGRGPVVNWIPGAPPRRVRDLRRAPVLPGKESPRAPLLSRGRGGAPGAPLLSGEKTRSLRALLLVEEEIPGALSTPRI